MGREDWWAKGVALHQKGALTEAEACYRRIPATSSNYYAVLSNLSAIAAQMNRMEEAVTLLRRALQLKPDYSQALNNLGNALHGLGRLEEAEQIYRRLVALHPTDPDVQFNLGVTLHQLHQLDAAEACYRRTLALNPNHLSALSNLGNLGLLRGRWLEAEGCFRRGLALQPQALELVLHLGRALHGLERYGEAEACFRTVLQHHPNAGGALNSLTTTLQALGRWDEAEVVAQQALTLDQNSLEALTNLGIIHHALGRLQAAESCYRRALERHPNTLAVLTNLALTLNDQGRLEAAEQGYRQVLALQPDHLEALFNLGTTLQMLNRPHEAEACYGQVLALKPDHAKAHNNLGNTLRTLGRLAAAESCYQQALSLRPDYLEALSNALFLQNYRGDNNLEESVALARRFGALVTAKARPFRHTPNPEESDRRLRVGLVSGDLRTHPVGFFLLGVAQALDRADLELVAYSNHPTTDSLTIQLQAVVPLWRLVVGWSDARLAQQIVEDKIDILVDLAGHSAHNRLPVFAWKPAPVQVAWLGYFATTGVAEMDYILGDWCNLPEKETHHFTETPWRLPEGTLCFTPPDNAPDVAPLPALSQGVVTFGCFNNTAKITPAVVACWARVLREVPQSRLMLKNLNLADAVVRDALLAQFAAEGIGGERLLLEGPSGRMDYLAAYHRVDVALDPFPFPGGATTVEGLWMGVPVVTRRGHHFLSHQGEDLLRQAGLEPWIAQDEADYVGKAVAFARDIAGLAALRAGLRQQVHRSPLFDAQRFAKNLTNAWREQWRTWCQSNG